MSFRKRHVGVIGTSLPPASSEGVFSVPSTLAQQTSYFPGVRPSPLDGRATTSTGTPSLDDLLAGHAGLVLGNSLLFEESGTTDYAGILLRFYAAEGVLQGHQVHVVGVGDQWRKDLPGPTESGSNTADVDGSLKPIDKGKMKIAWRYERLGEFGAGAFSARGGFVFFLRLHRTR
jgi:elongator complex protein 4